MKSSSGRRRRSKGFTLLEIVIVVTIIAAMSALIIPRLGGRSHEIKAAVRKLAIVSRDLRNHAKLYNATYRLVIQMSETEDDDSNEDFRHRYWVERTEGTVIRSEKDTLTLGDYDESDPTAGPRFTADTRILREPEILPRGMIFESIEVSGSDDIITDGTAYIYYLPEGFTEESVIHIKYGESLTWTVAIHPLTGKADIISEKRTLRDLRQQ